MSAERCLGCNAIIPEGIQVCKICLGNAENMVLESSIAHLQKAQNSIKKALSQLMLLDRGDDPAGRIDNAPGFDSARGL